jgi:putative restriction endonuclease
VGLEATHIRWHQAGGPDIEGNGMALCSLHHKLFDRGAFTLDSSFRVIVSDDVNGVGAEQVLWAYHQKNLNIPRQEKLYPYPDYVDWHVREVFHGNYTE